MQFIKSFSKIEALLISILKKMASSVAANLACNKADENQLSTDEVNSIGGGRIDDKLVNRSNSTKKISSGASYLTPGASLAFTLLRKVFTKALILHHFDSKHHIQIETNAPGYVIGGVLS